nr:oligopeptide ABC transporter ATP-binding protein OppF [Mycoplasma sp. Ms02]
MSQKYYTEKTRPNKIVKRPVREGQEAMLNAYPEKEALVEIRGLDIEYGSGFKKFRAINDLNLNIYKGEVLGLVGESGSGKSTTGRAVVGLTPYSRGHIKLGDVIVPKVMKRGLKFGKKLAEYKRTLNYMANKVQMIFQDPSNSLNPNINIEKIVSEGLDNLKISKQVYLSDLDQSITRKFIELYGEDKFVEITSTKLEKAYEAAESRSELNDQVLSKIKNFVQSTNDNLENAKTMLDLIAKVEQDKEQAKNKSEKEIKKMLIIDMLKQVGLDESILQRYPLEFSGGQQQRIGISRSIVLRPKILVADEPISALDVSIQAQVVNIFNELKERYKLTILFIAHDLRMVEYISDRIAVIYKGVLLEVGPTEVIIKNPLHPYTKSLLDAVPSIESKKGSLIGFVYNSGMHKYTKDIQPVWNDLGNKHFVLGTKQEIEKWKNNDYSPNK